MTSSANYSDVNVRSRRYRGIRSSKKSVLYSDCNTEEEIKNGNLGHRSISLTALPHNGNNSVSSTATPVPTPGPLLEPRMAQLETLEAKMASIEVSLSTAQRRKNGKKNGNGVILNVGKASLGGTSPANIFASIRSNTLIDTCRELEVLRNALKDKENTIQNLQGQINGCGRLTALRPLEPSERRTAELKLQSLKQEEESRKSAIKKINLTLEKVDANEANIDIRIKQAELEYELGREELGLLGIREELRVLQARLDAKPTLTLYSSINSCGKFTLHCVQLEYDPKSPRFGAGNVDDKIGLFVLWAAENSGMQKGDRILEVNGKLTLSTSKEEMIRLLTVCPSKAEIVLLREWIPPSAEDFLRRENLRLTHRISYLEDQVSELLMNVTSKDMHRDEKQTEIFQKGSHVALLAAGPKNCSKSGVSNNAGSNEKACSDLGETNQENRQGGDSINGIQRSNNIIGNVNGYIVSASSGQKYQESDIYKSCDESDKIRILTKKYESEELSVFPNRSKWVKNQDSAEENSKKHFNNLLNPKIHSTFDNSYSLSDLERPGRKSNNNLSRIYDYGSETNYSIYKSAKDKKIETDEESTNPRKYELSEKENGRSSNKPTPPKKPIRLSINRATSLQNVETCYSLQNAVRKIKRSHKGEAPPPPIYLDNKANGRDDSQYSDSGAIIKNPSRNETWKTPLESTKANFCWPANHHRSKCKADEKWC